MNSTLQPNRARASARLALALSIGTCFALVAHGQGAAPEDGPRVLQPMDIFELEYASDPQLSPLADRIVYQRTRNDVLKDRAIGELWTIGVDGSMHRPLLPAGVSAHSPRWSPSGDRLAYVASSPDGGSQIFTRWMAGGESVQVTRLENSPGSLSWSRDGEWLAFTSFVPSKPEPLAKMPGAPKGAKWAEAPKVIESVRYRADGRGYLEAGYTHVFVVPSSGGSARQVTDGDHDFRGPLAWSADGESLFLSADLREDRERGPSDSELYEVEKASGELRALTDRRGPDHSPVLSPDGTRIAYLGHDDELLGSHTTRLYVRGVDETETTLSGFDPGRSVRNLRWSPDGKGIWFLSDRDGKTELCHVVPGEAHTTLTSDVGGAGMARPYSGGSYSTASDLYVYTHNTSDRPAEVAIGRLGSEESPRVLTALNEEVLAHRDLARLEEMWVESSHDGLRIQSWILYPPDFEAGGKHPLLLEIHGGPFAAYGPHFSAELQLYAAAGYVVVYSNPRGSTSYGRDFANEIHHDYPGNDYDDLMSVVDGALARELVDPERMFVTGGSGGGVLSAWIVGKTDRFRAAVVAKPVINWTSFVLTADAYTFFWRYWFPGPPWEHQEHYWKRSPLSLVGNVTTPTMLLTGEQDHRTPISESEQYYQALQLREVPTALVRIPGSGHGIASRPSRLIAKVLHVLAWFERHDEEQ